MSDLASPPVVAKPDRKGWRKATKEEIAFQSAIKQAIKHVYHLDGGRPYDLIAYRVLQSYKRGGRDAVVSLLQSPELKGDSCAKIFREILHIRMPNPSMMFSFCQAKRNPAPDWIKDHGWRVKKWPDFLPYIHPKSTDR